MQNAARRRTVLMATSFFCVAAIARLPLAAQAQNPSGSLLVAVQDSSAARVAGADVSVAQEKSGIHRTGKSGAQGETRCEAPQPGSYTGTGRATGFADKTLAL